jgi:starvation-inducible outer membrane lipoprotein
MKNKLIVGLFMLSGCATMFSLHNKLDNIGVEVERVHVESIISSGKAIYMPGSVCVIKATSEVDVTKMREFASACINSHNNWLLINSSNTSYSDATEEIQR